MHTVMKGHKSTDLLSAAANAAIVVCFTGWVAKRFSSQIMIVGAKLSVTEIKIPINKS